MSALVGGAAVAAVLLGWPTAASVAGRLYLTRGFRFTTVLGTSLVLTGAAALAILGPTPIAWAVAICCLVMGFGFGFSAVPALVASQASVQWHERGVASGMIMFARSLGQAIGAAVLGAVSYGVIATKGGDPTDPATIIAASSAVFVGVALVALVHFVISLWMPQRIAADPAEGAVVADPTGGIDVAPDAILGDGAAVAD